LIGVIEGGFTSATTGVDDPKFKRLFNGLNAPAPENKEEEPEAVPEGEGFESLPVFSAIADTYFPTSLCHFQRSSSSI
jgi:hypothetical protein